MWPSLRSLLALVPLISVLVESQKYPEGRYNGVQRFLTRPDIECLSWKVTVYDEAAVAPGYWFVSPYEINGLMVPNGSWVGPHIYDHRGQLVWSGTGIFDHINVMDFKVVNLGGDDVLSMTYAVKGSAYILNKDYSINQTIDIGQTQDRYNMHDFGTVDNGNRFLYLKRNISYASAELSKQDLGYDGTCHVTFPEFEERDVKTGEVVHFWDATGIIPLSDSTMAFSPVQQRCSNGMWDYLHSNSIDKFRDGHYLMSTRHSDTIYKISKDDGTIMWRLHGQGGERSDFEMNNLNFTRQHHVKIRAENETHTMISFLDNAVGADPQPASTPWSRGVMATIREDTMQAEMIGHYDHPHQGHAFRRGNFQLLNSGNVFMGWSEQALHSEFTPDGTLVMEAELTEHKLGKIAWAPNDYQRHGSINAALGSYRSFKFEFDANPTTQPDIYSNASSTSTDTTTSVYVSWNGATRVATWMLYKTTANGDKTLMLNSIPRAGFETRINYDGYAKYVFVQAKDENGKALGESPILETTTAEDISNDAVAEEMEWLQSNSPSSGWISSIVNNSTATFIFGLFFGATIMILIGVAKRRGFLRRRSRSRPTYERVAVADTADFDETTLDDLRPRSYRDKIYDGSDDGA